MKIFLDVDATVVDSVARFIEIYNSVYATNVNPKDVKKWDFSDQCIFENESEIEDMFADKEFYSLINIFKDAVEVINRLKQKHDITFVSVGTSENVVNKVRFLTENFKGINQIMLIKDYVFMDKSVVNMEGGIFLDDHSGNLDSTNAKYKMLFEYRDTLDFNKTWCGRVTNNWLGFEQYVEHIEGGLL
jgi:5'(3')-deoxyribonucleotidase